ncbi:MAG: hypothetical protein ACREIQ_12645 [Nitrospiria bacterium]
MKYIAAVGVELEGGWDKRPKDPLHEDLSLKNLNANHIGEIASKPFKSLELLEAFLEASAPNVVNNTCGFHVHVSFKEPIHYHWLTTPRFYKLLLLKIKRWGLDEGIPADHHFWKRWRGTFKLPHNHRNYCRKEFIPEKQLNNMIKGNDGTVRHCHLNYCLAMHGTLELRLFPAFEWADRKRYFSAVRCFIDTIEFFLNKERTRKTNRIRIKITPSKLVRRQWAAI